jgi:hypothetical protein
MNKVKEERLKSRSARKERAANRKLISLKDKDSVSSNLSFTDAPLPNKVAEIVDEVPNPNPNLNPHPNPNSNSNPNYPSIEASIEPYGELNPNPNPNHSPSPSPNSNPNTNPNFEKTYGELNVTLKRVKLQQIPKINPNPNANPNESLTISCGFLVTNNGSSSDKDTQDSNCSDSYDFISTSVSKVRAGVSTGIRVSSIVLNHTLTLSYNLDTDP